MPSEPGLQGAAAASVRINVFDEQREHLVVRPAPERPLHERARGGVVAGISQRALGGAHDREYVGVGMGEPATRPVRTEGDVATVAAS